MAELYKIVIADDESIIRDGLIHLFPWEKLGFKVVGDFSNGREVLEYLENHEDIDVIFTDISMPVINGVELAERMVSKNIKVVFFSSYQEFEYARAAVKNKVFDYLLKPVKYQKMVSCLERLKETLDQSCPLPADLRDKITDIRQNPIPQVITYIESHLADCSLEEAASMVYLSPKYLSVLFKEKQGIGFSEYVQNLKMKKAAELLQNPTVMQYQIASLIGYESPKSFSRAFKAYYGITPREYRKSKGITEDKEETST